MPKEIIEDYAKKKFPYHRFDHENYIISQKFIIFLALYTDNKNEIMKTSSET